MTKLTDMSMSFLKNKLFLKYGNSKEERNFQSMIFGKSTGIS